jgi:hypothetical protein
MTFCEIINIEAENWKLFSSLLALSFVYPACPVGRNYRTGVKYAAHFTGELSAGISFFSMSWICSPNWQAFLSHVEMPSFGSIYTWSKSQTRTTPSMINIVDILFPYSQLLS